MGSAACLRLIRIGALVDVSGFPVPTLAGALVLGGDPTEDIPGAAIAIENDRGEERVYRGPTLDLVDRVAAALGGGGFAEGTREVLLNALLHRDWSAPVRHIPVRVLLRPGGIEVVSPGELDKERQGPRNATLMDLARRARWSAGEGRGLGRIREGGAGDLELRVVAGFTHARWTKRRAAEERLVPGPVSAERGRQVEKRGPTRSPTANGEVDRTDFGAGRGDSGRPAAASGDLSVKEAEALAIVASGHGVTRLVVESTLRCSRSTARNLLDALVGRGLVTRSATSPRSPFQMYRVAGGASTH